MSNAKNIILMIILTSLAGWLTAQGNAVSFDGVNDHVQVTPGLGITTVYTAEAWIYPTNLTGTAGDIATFGHTVFSASATAGNFPLWVTVYGPNVIVRSWTTSNTGVSYNAGLTVNQWYHIAVTATRGGLTKLFVNGMEVLSFTNNNASSWPASFTIGAIRPVRAPNNLPFQGLIDEVRVWNVIRTPGEILTNMNIPLNPSTPGLVGYWKFDETTGTIAYDSTTPAQNGTLTNGAFFVPSDLTLPIVLSSFTATLTSQYFVQLHWVTQSETDVMGYVIYRSETNDLANAYQASPMINATNTATQTNYSFTDSEVTPGTWYYWLQSVELNGSFNFHGPVMATVVVDQGGEAPEIPGSTGIKNVFPNPFNPNVTVQYEVREAQPVSVKIYNTRGQVVQSYDMGVVSPGIHNLTWQADSLPAGIYMIKMRVGNSISQRKTVLSK